MTRKLTVLVLIVMAVAALAPPAAAHDERETKFPSGEGSVPRHRSKGPKLVVCKPGSLEAAQGFSDAVRQKNEALFEICKRRGFRHIQAAVNAVKEPRTRIFVLPGTYLEQPSMRAPREACANFTDSDHMEYNQHLNCPNVQNLIAVLGDGKDRDRSCDGPRCRLQIEGTGESPADVVIDGRFGKLNVVRADRADGVYFKNFTVQHSTFNSLYVIETDGYVIDEVVARWNDEYGFLTFASDHGVYKNCEGYGNGDAGIYPGSAAPHFGTRYSTEIKNCSSHHNLLGMSGTAGNSLYVHDNKFFENSAGISTDSAFANHPGLPQGYSTFENNEIYSNNQNYYGYYDDGTCALPSAERGYESGVVCPSSGVPVGTGILTAGGNHNLFEGNHIYDNWRYGTILFWVPAYFRGESDESKQEDTSHFNNYLGNTMGVSPLGAPMPNGLDFWWDEQGEGNCWDDNVSGGEAITSDPAVLPDCDPPPPFTEVNTDKQTELFRCGTWTRQNWRPSGCSWMDTPEPPA